VTFHATEQLREDVKESFLDYLDGIDGLDPKRFVFVDEAAANYHLVRTEGRAAKGKRVYGRRPHQRGKRISMLGALGFLGLVTGMFWEGYVDAEAFEIFVKDYLLPNVKPGDIVIWDNYSVHKRYEYEKMLNEKGVYLLFLPPYSPELSPIEQCWSKIKKIMRRVAATTVDGLYDAFCEGFLAVTAENAQGWFRGCGYCA
jgi:transposase